MFSRERTIATPQVLRFARDVSFSPAPTQTPLGPLGFECSQHRQTLRPTVDGTRSKVLRPFGRGAHMAALFRHAGLSRARPILASQNPLYHRDD